MLSGFRIAVVCLLLFAVAPVVAMAADPCLECHGIPGFAVEERQLWVHPEAYAGGVHGDLTCGDCHKGAGGFPHDEGQRVRCDLLCHVPGASHEAIVLAEAAGVHAAVAEPSCLACHRGAANLDGTEIRALCTSCHGDVELPRRVFPDTAGAFGVRGHAGAGDRVRRPGCPECHGVHGVQDGTAARRSCSQGGCHPDKDEEFGGLYDHRGDPSRTPWGGAGGAVALLLVAVGMFLALHSLRGA